MIKNITVYLAVILFTGFGCKTDNETLKPKISGSAGEVLIVIPDALWNSEAGDTLKGLLSQEVPDLPQPEPMFNIIRVVPAEFDKIFQTHRNIIFVKIGRQYKTAKILVEHDKWAAPQYILTLQAADVPAFVKLIGEGGQSMIDRLNLMERNRIIDYYKHYLEPEIYKKLKENYYLTLDIPKGYSLDVDSVDFAWIASETPTTSQGIFIYTYPYTDKKMFTKEKLINTRNKFLKKYVHGEIEGTYMSTETLVPPDFREFTINGNYFTELKGLWKLENGYMGGPFISLSTVDKSRNRIVAVEGFVYAPAGKKRELLRQVESILYTLKIYPVKSK